MSLGWPLKKTAKTSQLLKLVDGIVTSTQYKKLAPDALQLIYLSKSEILQTEWKQDNKNIKNAKFIGEKLKTKGLMFLV